MGNKITDYPVATTPLNGGSLLDLSDYDGSSYVSSKITFTAFLAEIQSGIVVDNIYNGNGTLIGNRDVDLNSNSLTFDSGDVNITNGEFYVEDYINFDNTLINTLIGYQAGNSLVAPSQRNTLIGYQAGTALPSVVFDNTFLGYQAGLVNTGSGNIFIGSGAGATETGSSKLYIAPSSTTEPLIYGDFNLSQLKINGGLEVTQLFKLGSFTAVQASAISAVDGLVIYVTTTDPTFTSVGVWAYENGAWVKL